MNNPSKKLLAIKLGSLGDIFLMLGGLRDLADYAGGPIDVLTAAPYEKIFRRSPNVSNVFIDNRLSKLNIFYLANLRKLFNNTSYDLIVDFQNSRRTELYKKLLAPKLNWCQLGTVSPNLFDSKDTNSKSLAKFQHQLATSGISTTNLIQGDLSWLCDASEASSKLDTSRPSIVLLPGASARHQHKIWPHYDELARVLIQRGIQVFVVPGPEDMELCRSISGELLLENGKWLDFFQLAGVLNKATFVVGNDSGPTHLAASLGCSGVALFGNRTSEYANNMQRKNIKTIVADELSDISINQVVSAAMESCEL